MPVEQKTVLEEMLSTLPADPEFTTTVLSFNDYELMREVFGIAPLSSSPDVDADDLLDHLVLYVDPDAVSLGVLRGPMVSGFSRVVPEFWGHRDIIGYDFRDVTQSLSIGPSLATSIVRGTFDSAESAAGIEGCSICEAPNIEIHNGTRFYSWREDEKVYPLDRFLPPAFDELGRGGRLLITDEYVFRTIRTADMEAIIDTVQGEGEGESLADVELFQQLARTMIELGSYSMYLSGVPMTLERSIDMACPGTDEFCERRRREEAAIGTKLAPYLGYAVGSARDAQGPFIAVVLVHADSGTSAENTDLLQARINDSTRWPYEGPWERVFNMDTSEFRADGVLMIAKLRRPDLPLGHPWVIWGDGSDPLFLMR
ncbi:MAG: hypothetical protein O2854_00970 [Chloroflexi bacterium]|nr:hypothetical protein [Chloroflexota bacterium]